MVGIELRQAGIAVDHVGHLQCNQWAELAKAKTLSRVERLEEYGTETIVGEVLAANSLAAEILFPDIFAACPEAQAILELCTRGELRTLDEVADASHPGSRSSGPAARRK